MTKVLIADDSPTEIALIKASLTIEGYEIITAFDGEQAIEKAFREYPHCIVLDVVMPKQNGFSVCRKLRNMDATRNIPIILLSHKDTPLDQYWGLKQGADLYLTKPLKKEELLAGIRRFV